MKSTSRAAKVDGPLDAKLGWPEKRELSMRSSKIYKRILQCGPKEKCVSSPPRDRLSVGKRVLDARYRSRAYGGGCALFCLDTNRLLKISGRSLKERENKPSKRERAIERKRGGGGGDEEEDHTLQRTLQYSFTFARIIVFDDSIPFFAWEAHERTV